MHKIAARYCSKKYLISRKKNRKAGEKNCTIFRGAFLIDFGVILKISSRLIIEEHLQNTHVKYFIEMFFFRDRVAIYMTTFKK